MKDKFLSEEEAAHLESSLENNVSLRDKLLLLLALKTGARASELLLLKKRDVNPLEKSVYIIGLKNSNSREIPLPKGLFSQLMTYSQGLKEDDRLFNITYPRLDQIWRWHRPCNKKFHSLRHTCAISLYKKCRDVKMVQYLLGHKAIGSSMIYLSYVNSQSELRKYLCR